MFTIAMQEDDPMVTCPFDSAHRHRRSRIYYHISRCSKNDPRKHLFVNKRQCDFDVSHFVDKKDYEVSVVRVYNITCFYYKKFDGVLYRFKKKVMSREYKTLFQTWNVSCSDFLRILFYAFITTCFMRWLPFLLTFIFLLIVDG